MTRTPDIKGLLIEALGHDAVIADEMAMQPYLAERRGLFANRPALAVARPPSTDAVASVIRACAAAGVAVIPQGGNTGLVGGAAGFANEPAVILSLERMNRIRELDAENFTLTAEAGCRLSAVQDAAAAADRLFPLSYAAEDDCQIGGNLATNAGGMNVLRYGNARDLTLGVEVVLADGRVWDGLRSLRKDNSGYDLKDLFIGAEGTIGIITAASLKLFPAIREKATAIVGLASAQDAVALFAELRAASGDTISSCELMARRPLSFAIEHDPDCHEPLADEHAWYLLVELSSSAEDAGLKARLARGLGGTRLAIDYRIAGNAAEAADIWRLRNTIPGAQRHEGASIKNDISVPVSRMPDFIARASDAVSAACPGVRVCAFGHIGDGNIHFNLTRPEAMDDAKFLSQWDRLSAIVHDVVMDYRGSFAAEHGVGQLKPGEMARLKDPVEQDLLAAVKRALDPDDRLNPGKLLPRADG